MANRVNHRGFGHLRRLPSGRWQASYVGPDLDRYNAPSTFQNKSQGEGWLASEQTLIERGEWLPPGQRGRLAARHTFAAYAEEWLGQRGLKPRTREGYEHLLTRYLFPAFGAALLPEIRPLMVRRWWGSLNPSTPVVNARAYALLRAIMNTAVADELVETNPCRLRSASIAPTVHEAKPASVAELEAITAAMPDERRCLILLCSWCALRIGEALELRRGDVDLRDGTLRVERAVTWLSGRPLVGSPKSAAGRRRVTIPPHVLPAVKEHLERFTGPGRDALLFASRTGGHVQPSTIHRNFRKAREFAGRPDLHMHDLRHTGATYAAMTGATLAELKQRLGHSTTTAAMRYQHVVQNRDQEIARALSKLADGGG